MDTCVNRFNYKMDRFVVCSSGPQEPTAKKRCLDEPQPDTLKRAKFSDKDYDANKRLRKFQESCFI